MKRILIAVLLLGGCSIMSPEDEIRKYLPYPEQQKLVMAIAVADHACKQLDAASVKVCNFVNSQLSLLPNQEKFIKTVLSNPPGHLSSDDQKVMNNIVEITALYRDVMLTKRAEESRQRLWNSFMAGAAVGALLGPPQQRQMNCQIYNAHTPTPYAQCQ